MRVLFDTNVVLDVLLNRDPWVEQSSAVWRASDEGQVVAYITACVVADVFHIARRLTECQSCTPCLQVASDV